MVSSVLEGLGASVVPIENSDHEVPEDIFFAWLKAELGNLPEIIQTQSGYASPITAEVVLGLLEKNGCSDVAKLANNGFAIDGSACEGLSAAGKRGAKRVTMEYWVKFSDAAAKRRALERLAEVCGLCTANFSWF